MVDGQDSLISGAEMLAFESGACSVTVGHRAHNVCGAERTFEPVVDTNSKRKTLLFSRVLMLSMPNEKERLFKTKVGQASTGI